MLKAWLTDQSHWYKDGADHCAYSPAIQSRCITDISEINGALDPTPGSSDQKISSAFPKYLIADSLTKPRQKGKWPVFTNALVAADPDYWYRIFIPRAMLRPDRRGRRSGRVPTLMKGALGYSSHAQLDKLITKNSCQTFLWKTRVVRRVVQMVTTQHPVSGATC